MRPERKDLSPIQEAGLTQFERKFEQLDQQLADKNLSETDQKMVSILLKEKAMDIAAGGVEKAQTAYDERLDAITGALSEWNNNVSEAIRTSDTNLEVADIGLLKQEIARVHKQNIVREQINRGESAVELINDAIRDVVGAGQEADIKAIYEGDNDTRKAIERLKTEEARNAALEEADTVKDAPEKKVPSLDELQKMLEEKKAREADNKAA